MENILLREGEEEWRVCSKRETSAHPGGTLFETVQSKTWGWGIVRKWPAVKLGPEPVSQMAALARNCGSFSEEGFILAALSFLCIISYLSLLFLSAVRDSPQLFCAHPCRNRGAAEKRSSIVILSKSICRQSILSLNK